MIEIYVESKNKTKGKETTNEVDFVETIVKHWFPDFEYDKDFKVIGADGKDNLPNLTPSFELNNVNGDQTIVIFDADSADYFSIPKKSRKQRELMKNGHWMFDSEDYWNLDADYLEPLHQFLNRFFASQE